MESLYREKLGKKKRLNLFFREIRLCVGIFFSIELKRVFKKS